MLELEILIRKALRSVDTRTSSTIAIEEVSSLDHEFFDYSMESTAFVALRSAEVVLGLACAELPEVLCCAWHYIGEELHLDAAEWFASERDIEEDDRVWSSHGGVRLSTSCEQPPTRTCVDIECVL